MTRCAHSQPFLFRRQRRVSLLWLPRLLGFCLLVLLSGVVNADVTVSSDLTIDFESGMPANWSTTGSTCTQGAWAVVDPNPATNQLADDHTPNPAAQALITSQNQDVDGGTCRITSDRYFINSAFRLSVWWYYGRSSGGGGGSDTFLLEYSLDNGSNWTPFITRTGNNTSVWAEVTVDIPVGAHQLRVRAAATDGGGDNTVEAGLDDIFIDVLPPALSLSKAVTANADADGNGLVSVGDVLTYTVTVTALNSTQNNIVVTDNKITTTSNTCDDGPLAANANCQLVGTYTVTAADANLGYIANTATGVSAEAPVLVQTALNTPVFRGVRDVYYLPVREDQMLSSLGSIWNTASCPTNQSSDTNAVDPVTSWSTITVLRDNTFIFFDHWEDGYEANLAAPLQSTTRVWGDGNFSNGTPPNLNCTLANAATCDVLGKGSVIQLNNTVTSSSMNTIDFDGGDKFATNQPLSVSKVLWATGTGTLMAADVEVYPVKFWGLEYTLPVGQNLATTDNYQAFEYTGAFVMASEDNTTVTIDLNGDGTVDTTQTLNQGGSYRIAGGLLTSGKITADKPVQVDVLTGDICETVGFETRMFTLFPSDQWDNDYFNPVGTRAADPTTIAIFNPNATSITVLVEQIGGAFSTQTVAAGDVNYLTTVANGSGAHLCTRLGVSGTTCDPNGLPFYAVASIDSTTGTSQNNSSYYDWGFGLVPSTSISQQLLVGLGIGEDPDYDQENGSPIWITGDRLDGATPDGGTLTICVDYDNDGTDGSGSYIDPVTGLEYDVQIPLAPLESRRIFDTDGDQTGMYIWVCDTNTGDQQNGIIVGAWGQDPSSASVSEPGMDNGIGIPNLPAIRVDKFGEVSGDSNGDEAPNIGDTITYTVQFINVGYVPMAINAMILKDSLPTYVDYVPNTTEINYGTGGGYVSLADNGSAPFFRLSGSGYPVPQVVAVEQIITVRYDVIVTELPSGVICNGANGQYGPESRDDENCMTPSTLVRDYDDLPDTYGTLEASSGPFHSVTSNNLYLGALPPDTETAPSTPLDGTGDGAQDDGVTFSTNTYTGGGILQLAATVTGVNETGAAAMLCGYLDGAADGVIDGNFDRAVTYTSGQVGTSNPTVGAGNEELCIRVPVSGTTSVTLGGGSNAASASCTASGTTFTCTLNWTPQFTTDVTTYTRFRLTSDADFFSTVTGPSPLGEVTDGEVEGSAINFRATAAVIGSVDLGGVATGDFLNTLGVAEMEQPALLALLNEWDSAAAGTLSTASADVVRKALANYLDPDGDGQVAVLEWVTLQERGTVGFKVERADARSDNWQTMNNGNMLRSMLTYQAGGTYLLALPDVQRGDKHQYRLREFEVWGSERVYGPWRMALGTSVSKRTLARASDAELTEEMESEWLALGEGYMAQPRTPDIETGDGSAGARSAQNTASSRDSRNGGSTQPTYAEVRLSTGTPGLYKVADTDLQPFLGSKSNLLATGKAGFRNHEGAVPYFYDATTKAAYFVAQGFESKDTGNNAFLVKSGGAVAMKSMTGKGLTPATPRNFRDTLHFEENNWLLTWVHADAEADHFYWDYFYAQPGYVYETTLNTELFDPASQGAGVVRIALRGAGDEANGDDHLVTASLFGGTVTGSIGIDGHERVVLEIPFDQSKLTSVDGKAALAIAVESSPLNGSPWAYGFIESVDVEYDRAPRARNGQLWMKGVSEGVVTATGFTSNQVMVVENPGKSTVQRRQDLTITSAGNGTFNVTVNNRRGVNDFLFANLPMMPEIQPVEDSRLSLATNAADYLIIAPRELAEGAQQLAAYRAKTMTTKVVWLQDIYDQFATGRVDAMAINRFLAKVKGWSKVPKYVLLLGRGTLDHRNHMGYGESLIPLALAGTPWGLVASDNLLGDINGDGVKDFALARLNAGDNAAVAAYVSKLSAYEAQPVGAAWMKQAVVVADNPDEAGDFHRNGDTIASRLTADGLWVDKLYHPDDEVASLLKSGWANGDFGYVNYIGHGSTISLGEEFFLQTSDVASLTNGARLPIFTTFTCAAGDSSYPGFLSLADELVLHPNGGAIASIAPTGASVDQDAFTLNKYFVDALYKQRLTTGEAHKATLDEAKGEVLPFMLDLYQDLGDPAVKAKAFP